MITQQGTNASIKVHGWVPKTVLMHYWSITEYFLYPCIFEETFCLTAMESAASKTVIITNGLAGLAETARYGVIVPGNPREPEWQERCLEILKNGNFELEQNYQFAKSLTWESQSLKLSL